MKLKHIEEEYGNRPPKPHPTPKPQPTPKPAKRNL